MAYNHLDPGQELEISEHIYFDYHNAEMAELVKLPPEKLAQMEADSIEEEKAIHSRIQAVVTEWRKQAANTLNLRKAQQYLKVPPFKHTANQWTEDEYGLHEISNMVYRMTWRLYERKKWDRKMQREIPVAFELNWTVSFNSSYVTTDYSGPGWRIAGQDKKVFDDKASMEKYLQGRIAAYANLFTEISPPIPQEQQKRFFVNGVLLPGYTVESPERLEPDNKEMEDLLSFLSDEDISDEAPELSPDPQPEEKTPEAVWSRNRQQRQRTGRTPQAPAR